MLNKNSHITRRFRWQLDEWFTIDGNKVEKKNFISLESRKIIMMILPGMIEWRLAQQRMWFTSTPTIEAESAVDVFDSSAEAAARDLGKFLEASDVTWC